MMPSLQARIRADVRRTILVLLSKDLGYSHNHEVLRLAIDRAEAVTMTESETKSHLSWLEDQGLIETEIVGRFMIAKLTDMGLKVARGSEIVEGVSRPNPDDL